MSAVCFSLCLVTDQEQKRIYIYIYVWPHSPLMHAQKDFFFLCPTFSSFVFLLQHQTVGLSSSTTSDPMTKGGEANPNGVVAVHLLSRGLGGRAQNAFRTSSWQNMGTCLASFTPDARTKGLFLFAPNFLKLCVLAAAPNRRIVELHNVRSNDKRR